jgi:hypothetical protein
VLVLNSPEFWPADMQRRFRLEPEGIDDPG